MSSVLKIINELSCILCFLYQAFGIQYVFYTYSLATFQVFNEQIWPVAAELDIEGLDTPLLWDDLFKVWLL